MVIYLSLPEGTRIETLQENMVQIGLAKDDIESYRSICRYFVSQHAWFSCVVIHYWCIMHKPIYTSQLLNTYIPLIFQKKTKNNKSPWYVPYPQEIAGSIDRLGTSGGLLSAGSGAMPSFLADHHGSVAKLKVNAVCISRKTHMYIHIMYIHITYIILCFLYIILCIYICVCICVFRIVVSGAWTICFNGEVEQTSSNKTKTWEIKRNHEHGKTMDTHGRI